LKEILREIQIGIDTYNDFLSEVRGKKSEVRGKRKTQVKLKEKPKFFKKEKRGKIDKIV